MKWLVWTACVFTVCLHHVELSPANGKKELTSDTTKQIEQYVRRRRAVCTPLEYFQQDCNTCRCNADGVTFRCTQNECMEQNDSDVEVFMEQEGNDHIERHSVCQANAIFKIRCNTCACNVDGTDFRCTSDLCPLPDDVEIFAELQGMEPIKVDRIRRDTSVDPIERDTTPSVGENKTIICKAKATFKRDCNTCWCNEFGTGYYCTRKVCITEFDTDDGENSEQTLTSIVTKECRPDEVFELECNTCRCTKDGKSFSCTRRSCPEENPEDFVDYQPKDLTRVIRECKPNEVFEVDCNLCKCNPDGKSYSCTRRICTGSTEESAFDEAPPTPTDKIRVNEKCTPDKVFVHDCKSCRCNNDGSYYECDKDCIYDTPEDFVVFEDEKDPQERAARGVLGQEPPLKRCEAGEAFRLDCNTCLCDTSGTNFSCTRKDCAHPSPEDSYVADEKSLRVRRDVYSPHLSCVPGSTFMDEDNCNRCKCTDNGKCICSKKKCHRPMYTKDEVLWEKCLPGQTLLRRGDICTCSMDGKKSFCTVNNNIRQVNCVPGAVFVDHSSCTTCVCLEHGRAACTQKENCHNLYKDRKYNSQDSEAMPSLTSL